RRRELVARPAAPAGRRSGVQLRRVAHHHVVGRRVDGEPPGRLPARLVEAGERAPRIERLELRQHIRIAAVLLAKEALAPYRLIGGAVADRGERDARGEVRAARDEADEDRKSVVEGKGGG